MAAAAWATTISGRATMTTTCRAPTRTSTALTVMMTTSRRADDRLQRREGEGEEEGNRDLWDVRRSFRACAYPLSSTTFSSWRGPARVGLLVCKCSQRGIALSYRWRTGVTRTERDRWCGSRPGCCEHLPPALCNSTHDGNPLSPFRFVPQSSVASSIARSTASHSASYLKAGLLQQWRTSSLLAQRLDGLLSKRVEWVVICNM